MGVFPKIGVFPPKWMVYSGKPYSLMDDLGVPLFLDSYMNIPWKSNRLFFWGRLGNTRVYHDPKGAFTISFDGGNDFPERASKIRFPKKLEVFIFRRKKVVL